MCKKCTISRPADFHVHLRTGRLMYLTLKFLVRYYNLIVAMPNIKDHPICTLEDLIWYRAQVEATLEQLRNEGFLPRPREFQVLYMIKLTPQTTPAMIVEFKAEPDVVAMKEYPDNTTTNSMGGIPNIRATGLLQETLRAMEQYDLPLSRHCEKPGVGLLQAEMEALPDLCWLIRTYPKMRIVMEHVSTKEGTILILQAPANVVATITIQHLLLTTNDVLGQNHNLCRPVAQSAEDLAFLIQCATSGNPKFFFGSDSAIHPSERK